LAHSKALWNVVYIHATAVFCDECQDFLSKLGLGEVLFTVLCVDELESFAF